MRTSPYPAAVPGGDVTAGVAEYERLRETSARGSRRNGLGVLVTRGMAAYLKVAASLAAAAAPRTGNSGPPAAGAVATTLDAEVVRVWSRMVWAHANSP